jgi:hypothetical protein
VGAREEFGNAVRNRLPFEHADRNEYRRAITHGQISPLRLTSAA